MEYRKDIIGERLYASRNYNNLKQTYEAPGANRAQVDWALTLRQVRRPLPDRGSSGSASAPNLTESAPKHAEPLAPAHPDGPYHSEGETVGRYQNMGNTAHMVGGLTRVSSGAAHTVDWQLNLRDGLHRTEHGPENRWRRHYARSHQSFDMMKENCSQTNEEYQRSHITPQDRRPDRRSGAISIETIRDDPISFKRFEGCEGTHVGQWRHLIDHRRFGHKSRRQMKYETTLRENPDDPNGARLQDNRSDGCLVEMLGKKRFQGATHHEPYASRLPQGDPRLYHLYNQRTLPSADEQIRMLRMQKAPRRDAGIPDVHQPKSQRAVAVISN